MTWLLCLTGSKRFVKYGVKDSTHSNENFLKHLNLYEPQHEKTCLREFPTRPDINRPAQPQKLARVLKFRP